MLQIEPYILLPEYGTNTWLLYDDEAKEGILIDPSAPSTLLLKRIEALDLKIVMIVNTHGHGDHIGGNGWFRERLNCQLAIHPLDASMLTDNRKNFSDYMGFPLNEKAADLMLADAQTIGLGKQTVRVIHTPGHTAGCVCLLCEKYLISGDTLFEMSIGRTDFPGGSHKAIIDSIRHKLFVLEDDVIVFPGHGPKTSIGMEKKNNPFLRDR